MIARRRVPIALLIAMAAAGARAQTAVPLPPADLGQTNILDGEGGPGGLFELILTGSVASQIADERRHSLPGARRQRISTAVLHPVYTASLKVMGAHPGIEMLVPFARVHNSLGPGASGTASGIGDVTLAPFLQWSSGSEPDARLSIRAAVQLVAPTGARRTAAPVSVGSGAWQVSPYLAATRRLPGGWDVSGRVIYDRSGATEMQGPRSSQDVKAGDFVVINLAASRQVAASWRIGIGSYALLQTNRSRNGAGAIGAHQQVFALGPVASWRAGRRTLFAGIYTEAFARDRPSGINFNLRLQQPF